MGTIFLSAGHSLNDSGAPTVTGTTEAREMIRVRDATLAALQGRGLAVQSVPDDLSLGGTIAFINARRNRGDVAVELHGNSAGPSAHGTEAFYAATVSVRRADAETLLAALVARVPGLANRGAKGDNQSQHPRLGFCRDVRIPSVLVEVCFMSNSDDMLLLSERIDDVAQGLADGLQIWSDQAAP